MVTKEDKPADAAQQELDKELLTTNKVWNDETITYFPKAFPFTNVFVELDKTPCCYNTTNPEHLAPFFQETERLVQYRLGLTKARKTEASNNVFHPTIIMLPINIILNLAKLTEWAQSSTFRRWALGIQIVFFADSSAFREEVEEHLSKVDHPPTAPGRNTSVVARGTCRQDGDTTGLRHYVEELIDHEDEHTAKKVIIVWENDMNVPYEDLERMPAEAYYGDWYQPSNPLDD
ncbi:hypothetical protein CSUB01_09892 [Colletotrichum sublineola]|uniref:Uncharacterized protein n=1 Tax=Colletotrichum sublineola TaxID=1173701 RepID=A0A066XNU7_COLSU|nr:hypothetical protein CSUB01_09892 [Colletotrichum sublineola]